MDEQAAGWGDAGLNLEEIQLLSAQDLRKLYEDSTGLSWEEELGSAWLNKNHGSFNIFYKRPILTASAYVNLSQKASILSQTHCQICNSSAPIVNLPLRIKPESYQYLNSAKKKAFRSAIRHRFKSQMSFEKFNGDVCISVIFVCSLSRPKKDVDNLSKMLLDSLKNIVIEDDGRVVHLSVARLDHSGDEEYILIRIANSSLNDNSNVAANKMIHSWGGMPELKIEDYL
ncbi:MULTISPECIES: RusA family crossover junction endodeoxyribonuclease [Deinococcus]|uniref:RusA family crossover junction endodeoxyribonuclease n=1 Tax=Deinococcus rufus TaxID=2136097 RepID=A0ABV7Z5N6_9DEIO|nr:RusA family crossover junction endodeoxyribonuclease [Deinococcus sp. AB2017081]WQE95111.1 RusA family crossover junction endodeoxyribonuclease [Deinococcus sp. AB2017081]